MSKRQGDASWICKIVNCSLRKLNGIASGGAIAIGTLNPIGISVSDHQI